MKAKLFFILLFVFFSNYLFAQSNVDFENGNFNQWQAFIGKSDSGIYFADSSSFWSSRFQITSGNGVDTFSKLPIVCPNGGKYSVKLGSNDSMPSKRLQMLSIDIPITKPNQSLCIFYHFVSTNVNESNQTAPNASFDLSYYLSNYVAHIATADLFQEPLCCVGIPTFIPLKIDTPTNTIFTKHWEHKAFNLNNLVGRILQFKIFSNNCFYGGHWGYCYFDMAIQDLEIKIRMDTTNRIKLVAPQGYYYSWYKNYQPMHKYDSIISVRNDSLDEHYVCIINNRVYCNGLSVDFDSLIMQLPSDYYDKVKANASKNRICSGDSVTLFSSGLTNSISWNNSIQDSSTIKLLKYSTFIVSGKNNYNIVSYDTITIKVDTLPKIGAYAFPNDTFCKSDMILLIGTGANNYIWSNGIFDSQYFFIDSTQTYIVIGTDGNNCKSTAQITIVIDSCQTMGNGILSHSTNELNIYPNPVKDKLSVRSNQFTVNTIVVTNLLGQVCIIPPCKGGKGDFSINISTLSNGIYFIKATDEKGNISFAKFIKE